MTVVVGVIDGGQVHLGADSAATGRASQNIRLDSKVFRNGPYVMGFTGSYRMGQLLNYKLRILETPDEADLHRFMATTFIDAVRQTLKDGGYATEKDGEERGGNFIVGVAGNLFEIQSDYQVSHQHGDFTAVGSGEDLALGSLASTGGQLVSSRIDQALSAACRFNSTCREPFVYASTRA